MISVLVVEDEEEKRAAVCKVLQRINVRGNISIDIAISVAGARDRLFRIAYDLMVLDMRLPLGDDDEPDSDAGVYLLEDCVREADINSPTLVMGLTAYEEAEVSFGETFSERGWQLLRYSRAESGWEDTLVSMCTHLQKVKLRNAIGYQTDVVIVTALAECEGVAVANLIDGWERYVDNECAFVYHRGLLRDRTAEISIVRGTAARMGMAGAAALTMDALWRFRPRLLAMVGIAAGVKGNFGDILIADHCFDYESGKRERIEDKEVFRPSADPLPVDPLLRGPLHDFALNQEVLDRIQRQWRGERVGTALAASVGPIGSGAAVVKDRAIIDEIVDGRQRKLIGLEMEAFGVLLASSTGPAPHAKAMIIKSLCDYGDHNKADKYRDYAAYTSASFMREFVLDYFSTRR